MKVQGKFEIDHCWEWEGVKTFCVRSSSLSVPSDLSDKVEGSDENIDVSRAPNEEVDDSRGAHAARQLPVSS